MTATFNIQVDFNGWLIPLQVERKESGIFKIAYQSVVLGHLLVNETAKWMYVNPVTEENLLNPSIAEKISKAIINY